MSSPRRREGKQRAIEARDEGPGATDGIVLPLELVGSGIYDVAYTLPVKFGSRNQQLSLQIDTGSSDLWVASTSCSSRSCAQTSGRLYNPSGSRATGVQFNILYLQGSASGSVVWDSVSVGGYTIDNQAFGAVSDAQNEPLAPNFSGILGLALPLNSVIADSLPPVTTNDPDGAAWASNLFSITPSSSAPAAPFLSLSLSRPGSDQIPSLLGIGRHPSSLVPDPSKILYSTLLADRAGTLFWKVNVRAITVYVNGQAQHVSVGRSVTGGVFPSAVLDSGVPLILTTSTIANGIYGAIGINPASDGLFYVPCKTPLNLTMTIDNRPEIPLHPLDLTADPPDDNRSDFCIGLIQTADKELSQRGSSIGDIVLGVPFLRNVYTVMAYSPPNATGSFPRNQNLTTHINPRLGLMSLTNASRALDEFNTVRVLNKPLTSSNTTSGVNDTKTVNFGGAKLSMGITVLLGLSCFIGLCGVLFLVRYLLMRRRFRRAAGSEEGAGFMDQKAAYKLVKEGSAGGLSTVSEDQLRQIRYDTYKRKTVSTASSDRTQVESLSLGKKSGNEDEFGFGIKIVPGDSRDEWDPEPPLDWGGDTLVGRGQRKRNGSDITMMLPHNSPPSSPERSPGSHSRRQSESERVIPSQHQAQRSVDIPLLSARSLQPPPTVEGVTHETSDLTVDGLHGEALKSSSIPPPLPSDRYYRAQRTKSREGFSASEALHGMYAGMLPYPDTPLPPLDADDPDELGVVNGTSMAGVGTASRTNKISRDSALLDRYSLSSMREGSKAFPVLDHSNWPR